MGLAVHSRPRPPRGEVDVDTDRHHSRDRQSVGASGPDVGRSGDGSGKPAWLADDPRRTVRLGASTYAAPDTERTRGVPPPFIRAGFDPFDAARQMVSSKGCGISSHPYGTPALRCALPHLSGREPRARGPALTLARPRRSRHNARPAGRRAERASDPLRPGYLPSLPARWDRADGEGRRNPIDRRAHTTIDERLRPMRAHLRAEEETCVESRLLWASYPCACR